MCGPPDFDALHTSILRLAELSAAGLTGYSVYRVVSLCRTLAPRRRVQKGHRSRHLPRDLAPASSARNRR
jgi:hypothetical protein